MVGRAHVRAAIPSTNRSRRGAFTSGGGEELGVNAVTIPAGSGVLSRARDYISLLKLRIVLLLDATAIAVMIPAAHGHPRVEAVLAVFAGGTLAAGGAHAINCWFDRDIDAEMTRTRRRPIPDGRIPAWHALAIGIVLVALSFAVLWAWANLLAAALALAGALISVLGLGLVAVTVLDLNGRSWTRRVFTYSIVYVALLFGLFAVSPFVP